MKKILFSVCIVCLWILTGCASTNATKATQLGSKEICIIDNPETWQDFRDAYERKIQAKGYKTKIVTDAKACQVTTTYAAKKGYDGWGPYLAQVDLMLFSGQTVIGQANYHAPMGLASHGSFETKIESIVDQMLPSSEASKDKSQ